MVVYFLIMPPSLPLSLPHSFPLSGYGIVYTPRVYQALRQVDRGDFMPEEVREEGREGGREGGKEIRMMIEIK